MIKVHGQGRKHALNSWVRSGGVAVTTYETTGYFKLEDDFRFTMLVVDEAHYIKYSGAARSKNVKSISEHANRMLFMTGTALENKVDEMIALIDILRPEIASSVRSRAFMATAPQFRERVAPVYYRRKREQVLTELPELIENKEWCTMTPQEEEVYEKTVSEILRISGLNFTDYRIIPYLPHYLITLSRFASEPNSTYSPAVFRMSRIVKLYDTPSYGSGKITAKEKKMLEEAIKHRSIPYLLDDTDDYSIELTPDGISMYKSILHLRPVADDSKTKVLKSGSQIMHFHCTYRQIENYFFKFGKDAKILAPKEAADRFKAAYKAALESYK